MKTLVTEAIRRMVNQVDVGGRPEVTNADVELVRAWLDGSATAGVAMTGADLEGILECIEIANTWLPGIDDFSRNSPMAAVRSTWRIKGERIRRAVHWASPLLGGIAQVVEPIDAAEVEREQIADAAYMKGYADGKGGIKPAASIHDEGSEVVAEIWADVPAGTRFEGSGTFDARIKSAAVHDEGDRAALDDLSEADLTARIKPTNR